MVKIRQILIIRKEIYEKIRAEVIGFKRYFKLLKNWKGNSSVTINEEEYRVVYYKLFGQR